TKRLFAGQPSPTIPGDLWEACLADLREPTEARELGLGLFLDRPFGAAKAPGEPDRTPLLAYEAFSRSVAERRLQRLALSAVEFTFPEEGVRIPPPGRRPPRPGVASIRDALRIAPDFLILGMTRGSRQLLLAVAGFSELLAQGGSDDLKTTGFV